jgi:hypothetical protein
VKDSSGTAAGTAGVTCTIKIEPSPPTANCLNLVGVQGVPLPSVWRCREAEALAARTNFTPGERAFVAFHQRPWNHLGDADQHGHVQLLGDGGGFGAE